jgi:hypothetical protein
LLFFSSCDPTSKEQYLKNYKEFIDEITKNGKGYNEADWAQANEKYSRYNNELYNRFKDELTVEDKMRITGYKFQYSAIRAGSEIGKFYQSYLKKDVDKLKDNLEFYVKNHMEDDLSRLLDESRKISKDLYIEMKKLIEELKEEYKKK